MRGNSHVRFLGERGAGNGPRLPGNIKTEPQQNDRKQRLHLELTMTQQRPPCTKTLTENGVTVQAPKKLDHLDHLENGIDAEVLL
jgi:hypothetical protein